MGKRFGSFFINKRLRPGVVITDSCPRLRGADGRERKQFFFEKKNQKTFDYVRLALPHRAHQ
jgi:hypothetical protein